MTESIEPTPPLSTTSFLDRNKFSHRFLICLIVTCLVALLSWLARHPSADEFYNTKARLLAQTGEPDDRIMLLSIDDYSLSNMEAEKIFWPWPRSEYGNVTGYCRESSLMTFDMLYDLRSPLLNQDSEFVDLVRTYRAQGGEIALGLMLKEGTIRKQDDITTRYKLPHISEEMLDGEIEYEIGLSPFAELLDACDYVGHTSLPGNRYGRYSLLANYSGNIYPSLSLSSVMAYQGVANDAVTLEKGVLDFGDRSVLIDPEGNAPYRHYRQMYPNCSFFDVWAALEEEGKGRIDGISGRSPFYNYAAAYGAEAGGRVGFAKYKNFDPNHIYVINREMFKDKILVIGSTGTGVIADREPTPISVSTPGVFIHTIVIDNLLNGTRIWDWDWRWDLILVFLLGLLPAAGDTPWRLISGGVLTWFCYIGISIILLLTLSWFLPWLWPSFALITSTILLAAISWGEERLQRSKLEEMEHAKQQFTDMLVHDLKGRVSSMVMSMSLIETEVPDESRARKLVNTMQSSGSRLLTQVNALLDIRKIEEGRMKLEWVPVNLHDVLREVIQDYRPNASLIRLAIEEDFDSNFNRAVALDPDIFRRILENLIWNALQYAKKGTTVLISTHAGEESYTVSVCNRGKVIPEKTAAQLFKPFVSGKDSEKNVKTVSTGLGLAFCRLAAEAHLGKIDLVSPWELHDDGVRVVMELPYAVG